jgi:uncharacterized membrane protein YecN with MAPEG domain
MTGETDAKIKEDLLAHQRRLGPLRIISIIITIIILAAAFFDQLPWTVTTKTSSKTLSFENRLTFTLQLLFIDFLPLFIAIFAVINVRISSIAINPMDSRGHVLVEKQQRILQNTLEQLIIKIILSLVLCTVLRSNELIILPVFTILFVVGRFTFALGYPNYRSFGMAMNFVSTALVMILISYRLFIEGALFEYIKAK